MTSAPAHDRDQERRQRNGHSEPDGLLARENAGPPVSEGCKADRRQPGAGRATERREGRRLGQDLAREPIPAI